MFLALLLIQTFLSIGQSKNDLIVEDEETSNLSAYGTRVVVKKPSKNIIQGHEYFENENKLASVFVNKQKSRRAFVRYNALNDQIEVTEVFNVLKRDNIEIVLDEGYAYKVLDFEGTKQFFVFLKEGKTSLVMKVEKKIKQGREAIGGYQKTTKDKYVEKHSYFILNEEGELLKMRLKEKDILRVLGDRKSEIEKYISSKKLNCKKEKDVVKIVNYYNTLTN